MRSEIERTTKTLQRWCRELPKKAAIPGFSAYSLFAPRKPLAYDTFAPEGIFDLSNILLFAALMMLYMYFSFRFARYAVLFSGTVAPLPFYNATKSSDLAGKKIVTIYGRLKVSGQAPSEASGFHFILEDAANNRVPIAPWVLEGASASLDQIPKTMDHFLGKQLVVKGKVHLNPSEGEYAVVPELVMEVLPPAPR